MFHLTMSTLLPYPEVSHPRSCLATGLLTRHSVLLWFVLVTYPEPPKLAVVLQLFHAVYAPPLRPVGGLSLFHLIGEARA